MLYSLRKYLREIAGSIMVSFALMAPFVLGAAGMALDYSNAYLVQQRLQQALDSASLAAAAASTDPEVIEQKVIDFFEQNYPEEKLGATFTPEVVVTDSEVIVSGYAIYNTFFLSVINFDQINVRAESTIHRDVRGLEVALVLDNTGSMSDGDKITALKTAATNFVNILYSHTNDETAVKIGLVPYANGVRVGKYGLGQNPDGSEYDDGYVFVNLPSDVAYTTNHDASSGWYGCVVEHNPNDYDSDATYVAGSKGQLWRASDGGWDGHGWDPGVSSNDPHPGDVTDEWEGPWDIYQYGTITNNSTCVRSHQECTRYRSNGQCRTWSTVCDEYNYSYSFSSYSRPNQNCPYTGITPLTSQQEDLLDQINTMRAHGNTLGNVGLIWGQRILSPERPFTEGVDWDSERWHKAIVMMTDGINTRDGTYSNFWVASKNGLTTTNYNDRFLEICDDLKEKGVTIYTIILGTGGLYPEPDQTTKDYYKACATTEDQYYDAPSNEELVSVFEEISRQLSNIYIAH